MTMPTLTYKPSGHGVHVDLDRLVASRMLVQANSGGGKSRAIRQLLEETHGRVQHLVIDPEGEFPTLREDFDYVLAARQGGEVLASPKLAKTTCRRFVELGVSAIIDLYDLSLDDRRAYVRYFLTELMALPRALWRPIIVVIDEMHVFAPEAGQSQAAEAVTALATQGRKRGFCLVGATQRISKLHKDVAAELLNKMIGRTGLDIDVKRAGDELGMGKEDRAALKTLAPGEFYVYGPAISNEVQVVRTGDVVTSHPEAGRASAAAPPPTAKIRALLADLADLPKEAEEEARTVDELRRENARLKGDLTRAQRASANPSAGPAKIVEKPVVDQRAIDRAIASVTKAHAATIKELRAALEIAMRFVVNVTAKNFDGAGIDPKELEKAIQGAMGRVAALAEQKLLVRQREVDEIRKEAQRIAERLKRVLSADQQDLVIDVAVTRNEPFSVDAHASGTANGNGKPSRAAIAPRAARPAHEPHGDLSKGQQKILNALAELEAIGVDAPGRAQLGMFAGYNLTGGSGGQYAAGKELHLCPLQFDIVDRLITRFSNAGDVVYDPFGGLGTVAIRAVELGRRGLACELNTAYWADAVWYLRRADERRSVPTLFDLLEPEPDTKIPVENDVHLGAGAAD